MTQQDIQQQIDRLTEERRSLESSLQQGDYKVIKCAEAQAVGEEMPYDAEVLHTQRQAWRDRINEIDVEIETLSHQEYEEDMAVAHVEQ